MPFSIQVEGMNELIRSMEKLPEKAAKVAAEALYEGAGIVADKVSGAVNGIATEPFKYAKGGRMRKPSPEEKALVAGAKHGVAKFRKNGVSVQTSVGYQNAGYGTINGKTKPIPQIANAINSGTSFMQRQPFMRKAFSQSKGPAQAAIEGGIHARESELNPD
jgi:HK97 gp10 family phage protein